MRSPEKSAAKFALRSSGQYSPNRRACAAQDTAPCVAANRPRLRLAWRRSGRGRTTDGDSEFFGFRRVGHGRVLLLVVGKGRVKRLPPAWWRGWFSVLPDRKSAARCAYDAAVKIARLSFFKTVSSLGDIGRMIGPGFRRQIEVGAEEGRAKFGDQFLHRIPCILETLLPEFTGEARRVTGPVRQLMRQNGVIAFRVPERLEMRHLHIVEDGGVKSPVARHA